MAILQAVGISVSHYTGHSVSELDDDNCTSEEQMHTVDRYAYTQLTSARRHLRCSSE